MTAYIIPDKLDITGFRKPYTRIILGVYSNRHFVKDGMNTMVRGQKAIFSASGLPHSNLAAVHPGQVLGTESKFAVVFAAMGITFEEAD